MRRYEPVIAFGRWVSLALALLALSPTAGGGSGHSSSQHPRERRSLEPLRLDKGVFLVAKPRIAGGPFSRSVVLLLAHGESGTLGLIVNRATDIPLSQVLPDLNAADKESHSLFFGGPVTLSNLIFLFRSAEPPKRAEHVMGDVYYSGDREALEELLKRKKRAEELRLYIGHSGWAPGQLQREIARGDWQLARADAKTVFHNDPDTIWPDLIERERPTLVADGRPLRPDRSHAVP
ncbi:MAG: YqgE/AlgH family protein [Acidobacteriota bacterium]